MATTFVASANTRTVDWSIALIAGIVAMVVFAIIEMAFSWAMRGASALSPLAVFGTATLDVLMPSAHAGGGPKTMAVGAASLLAIGAVSGIVLAYLVDRVGVLGAAIVGVVFGLAMYAIDVYGIARLVPALAALRDWMSAIAYAIQGVLAAVLYKVMTRAEAAPVADDGYDLRNLRHAPLA